MDHESLSSRTPPIGDVDVDFFVQLESAVWTALVTGDARADEQLLADDFLGVYGTGFAGKSEHVDQLESGPTVLSYSLSQARATVLGEGVVILSYLAKWTRRNAAPDAQQAITFVSSIWKWHQGVWRNVFSQDTKAED